MTTNNLRRYALFLPLMGLLLLGGLLVGCGSRPPVESEDASQASEPADDAADLATLERAAADVLCSLAEERFQMGWEGRHNGYYGSGVVWADDDTVTMAEERFPAWAVGHYQACFYWERSLSYESMNRNRQRGEPRMFMFQGRSWGWILMKNADIHILELGIEFEDTPHLFVDAWAAPEAAS